MQYVIKFMFYAISVIAITIPAGLYIGWSTDGKKVDFKDYCKTF